MMEKGKMERGVVELADSGEEIPGLGWTLED